MERLYNRAQRALWFVRNAGKFGLLMSVIALSITDTSCRKAAVANPERGAALPSAEAITEAEQLYAGRADLAKVRQGIMALWQAQAEDQTNYELAWRLAKFNYFLGAHSPDATEKDKAFHDGIEAGKLAVKLQDGKPDGHFWLGANYGGNAQISVMAGLSGFENVKHEMETVIKLDEGYQSGSAYVGLGQLYLESPGVLGGDTQKAIEYLEKGLRIGPGNAFIKSNLAAAYAAANRNEDARKQIDALLAMKAAPGFEPEYNDAVAQARKVQEKIK